MPMLSESVGAAIEPECREVLGLRPAFEHEPAARPGATRAGHDHSRDVFAGDGDRRHRELAFHRLRRRGGGCRLAGADRAPSPGSRRS